MTLNSEAQALAPPRSVGIMNVFAEFQSRIAGLIEKRIAAGELPRDLDLGRFVVEPPRDAAHGDLSTNAAMVYAREAKQAGSSPRALAEGLVADLRLEPDVQSAEAAGPGFINIVLKPEVYLNVLTDVLIQGTRFGAGAPSRDGPVNVEYVSANPTGPMHVGHARGAVFGDALASLLVFSGREATREYYINDAGGQVDVLARSAFLRYREALGEDIGPIPEGLYPGDYLKPVGEYLAREFGAGLVSKPEAEWLPVARKRAIEAMMAMIRDDLAALNITHDVFASERALTGADGGEDQVAEDDRMAAGERPCLPGPAAAAQGQRARRRLGGSRADPVPLDRLRRRRRPAADQVGRRIYLFRQRHRLSQDQDRPRFQNPGRRLGRRPRRLCQADAGGGRGAVGRQGEARGPALPARAPHARRRAGQNVEALRRVRDAARGRGRGRRGRRPLHHADAQERRAARFRPR